MYKNNNNESFEFEAQDLWARKIMIRILNIEYYLYIISVTLYHVFTLFFVKKYKRGIFFENIYTPKPLFI